MTTKEFIEKLTDILDCEEELTMETELSEIEEWDSLGVISFLADMGRVSLTPVKAVDVKAAKPVGELFALIQFNK